MGLLIKHSQAITDSAKCQIFPNATPHLPDSQRDVGRRGGQRQVIMKRPPPHIGRVHRLNQIPTRHRRQTIIHGELQLPRTQIAETVNARKPEPGRILKPVGEHMSASFGRGAFRVGQDELNPCGGVLQAELDADSQHLSVLDQVLGVHGDVDHQLPAAVLWVRGVDGCLVRFGERLQVTAGGTWGQGVR